MPRSTFLKTLDFLARSGIHEVRLLGGEPTLHPDFLWMVEQSIRKGYAVVVFTNGILAHRVLLSLRKFNPGRVKVVVNVNDPDFQPARRFESQARMWAQLRGSCMLGFNIHTLNPHMGFLLDLVDEFNLCRSIRLGLAHPCLNATNKSLLPKEYAPVGERVSEFFQEARLRKIHIAFDCGFVPCMFPRQFIDALGPDLHTLSNCGPIPDILPDGTAAYCYPLASLSRCSVDEGESASSLKKRLEASVRTYRRIGIYQECLSCQLRDRGICSGGCLSAALQRLRSVSGHIHAPFREDDVASRDRSSLDVSERSVARVKGAVTERVAMPVQGRFVIPYVDQPREFWQQLKEEFGPNIHSVYFPLPGSDAGSGRPVQPRRFMKEFLSQACFGLSALINPVVLRRPVREVAPSLINILRDFNDKYGLADVTLANVELALRVKDDIPSLRTVASTLMDISRANQLCMVEDAFDVIVPSGRIMRDLATLRDLKRAFRGKIRMIVNEGCLPGCPFRVQHFFEMASDSITFPDSLCRQLLDQRPWMRLTGAWVLPQHLFHFDGLYDELKLAGRITLNDPLKYRRVLGAYVNRQVLSPNDIGGGPASVLQPIEIEEGFYAQTLHCNHRCDSCTLCAQYYEEARRRLVTRKSTEEVTMQDQAQLDTVR